MKKLSSLIVIIFFAFTAQSKELSRKSEKIYSLIAESQIPEQLKEMYFKVTIVESGWHQNKRASRLNNFSGFRAKTKKGYRLIEFQSIESWIKYSENFFKRKNLQNVPDFLKFIKRGKYCASSYAKAYIRTLNLLKFEENERFVEARSVYQYSICARRNGGIVSYSH